MSAHQTEEAALTVLFAQPELLDVTALRIEHFKGPLCREVFRAQRFLRANGMVANAITVHEYIRNQPVPDDLKSFAQIAEIETSPTAAGESVLKSYERLIIHAWRRRHLAASHEKARIALVDNEDPNEVQAQFERDVEQAVDASSAGLRFRTPKEICESVPAEIPYIWKPYLVAGCITEMSGLAKRSGKTTLQTALARAVIDGAPFLGFPTRKANITYLSEEGDATFSKALRKAGLANDERISVLQWKDVGVRTWPEIVRGTVAECERIHAGLLFIDTLPQFAQQRSDTEKNDGDAREALLPMLQAAATGLAILVDRHERKSGGQVGESARGSSQYTHGVDIILSLRRPEDKNLGPNVRVIHALSRFDETPETFTIDLTDAGYIAVDPLVTTRQNVEAKILEVLPSSEGDALKADEIIAVAQLKKTLAYQALESLLRTEAISRIGAGKRGNPFRYYKDPE